MALFLNHWGKRKKLYSHIPFLSISPGTLYSTLLIIGLVMTLSRGPILSYLIGALFIGIGYLKNRPRNFVIRSITLLCLLAPLFFVYQYYASLDNTKIIAGATGSAVYRTKLIDLYLPFILQKPYWGWGSITYPFVEAYSSIDNHYLFLAIQYGLVTLSLFLSIPMVVIWKLFNQDRKQRFKGKIDPTIIYTLIACYVVILACLLTVYLGEQLEELFFILTGISQGILLSNEAKAKRSLPQTSAKINYHPQTIPVTT
ncbi:MAG: O-antigen ligase family protein [Waddliaceae bacterium]